MGQTPHSIIIPDRRSELERALRAPETCLYCESRDLTLEHPLAEALGGRLSAPILCASHNGAVNKGADEPMIVQLAPLVHMLGVRRQRSRPGSSFGGRLDDGQKVTVKRDGQIRRKTIDAFEMGPNGKAKYAKGALNKLDELKAAGVIDESTGRVIATAEKPEPVTFEITIARDVERGVLKTALHFVAGFVTDISRSVAEELMPCFIGDKVAGGEYVRTLPVLEQFFDRTWPPMHEIRTYPAGDETYATVLLFGMHGFHVRLPVRTDAGWRYLQPLFDRVDAVFERSERVRTFGWDDRLLPEDLESHKTWLNFCHEKVYGVSVWRTTREQCEAAARRAGHRGVFAYGLSFDEAYRAELQVEALSPELILMLVRFAAIARATSRPPWAFTLDEFVSW